MMFVLGDCNCRIGSVESDFIGGLHPDFEDEGGELLHAFSRANDLIIPSTFEQWHQGPSHTYEGPNGGRSRIDFILIPLACATGIVKTFAHTQMDILNGDLDHLPLCLECSLVVQPTQAAGRFHRTGFYDRTVARAHQQTPALQQILDQCPVQQWSMDVNDHWDHLRNHLQHSVQQVCPWLRKKRQRRQLYFSEAAWNVLCIGKDLRQQYREMQVQFGDIENTETVSVQDLLDRSVCHHQGPRQEVDLLNIPTIYQLEHAIRQLQASKACGVDGIGAEILQADPCRAAKLIFPILVKSAIRGQGIMEMSGGWLLPLYKGKGSIHCMAGFRAIMLESNVSRALSKAWRGQLVAGLQKVACPMQWGGRSGLAIGPIHLHVYFWKRRAKRLQKSHAVIFLDIKAAFYSVVKQMVAGSATGMKDFETIFQRMGLPQEMYNEFLQQIEGTNLVQPPQDQIWWRTMLQLCWDKPGSLSQMQPPSRRP